MADLQNKYDKLLGAVKLLGSAFMFKNFDMGLDALPYLNLSFSSSGEDLWLRQFMKPLLKSGRPGFYVDVGSNQPINTSNTYLFYCHGWRGVCVDANPRFESEFRAARPRDVFVHAAVTDTGKSLYFAEHRDIHKMARVKERADDFNSDFLSPKPVPAMPLAEILRRHVPPGTEIDFMSLDVEDAELQVLRSNDWSTYLPQAIMIEKHFLDPIAPFEADTIAFLRDRGYRYRGYCVNNVLMTGPNFVG